MLVSAAVSLRKIAGSPQGKVLRSGAIPSRIAALVIPSSAAPATRLTVRGRFVHFRTSASAIVPADVERPDIEADHIVILVAEHHALVHRFCHSLLAAHRPKHIRSNGGQKFIRLRLLSLEG